MNITGLHHQYEKSLFPSVLQKYHVQVMTQEHQTVDSTRYRLLSLTYFEPDALFFNNAEIRSK
jgi:hypothetical protein